MPRPIRRTMPSLKGSSTTWQPPAYRPPADPRGEEYFLAHRRFTSDAMGAPELLTALSEGAPLRAGYGERLDERVIEWPWLLANHGGGPTLDAGSTLNHAHVIEFFVRACPPITIATLKPEPHAFTEHGVSYVYADLRDLPFRSDLFKTVVCASTLEHIGMDNSVYGDDRRRSDDPDAEMLAALSELIRVTQSGGTLLITVPYGKREDLGWLRQFDKPLVEAAVHGCPGVSHVTTSVYAYSPRGWRLSDLDAAANASYFDMHASDEPARDGAAAARAIACIVLRAD